MKYVTYLTTYTGDKLPPLYIGSTSEEKAKSGKYFGSIRSKKWKEIFDKEILENIQLFQIEILSYHDNRQEAFDEEVKLQKQYDVVKSKEYFNQSFAHKFGWGSLFGEDNGMFGRNHTDESRKLQSDKAKNRIATEETREILRKVRSGEGNSMYGTSAYKKWIEKYGKEIADEKWENQKKIASERNLGQKRTEETKLKSSQSAKNRTDDRTMSEETKKKISESLKNKIFTQETINKRIETRKRNKELGLNKTIKMSEESNIQRRNSLKGRPGLYKNWILKYGLEEAERRKKQKSDRLKNSKSIKTDIRIQEENFEYIVYDFIL